jgi:phenylalanyl-tRNA synthetase alpha subunit
MELQHLLEQAKQALESIQNMNDLNNLKAQYLGKKGEIASLMMTLKDLPNE